LQRSKKPLKKGKEAAIRGKKPPKKPKGMARTSVPGDWEKSPTF